MKENIYPPMHTAEHILNQTMVRTFGCDRCFSAHIEKKKSKCDYKFNRALTEMEIKDLEKKINEVIEKDLPVTVEMMPLDEVKQKFVNHVPESDEQNIRVITIGDYDAIPCIGDHIKSTKEIGKFRIVSSDFADGVLRIRYKLN